MSNDFRKELEQLINRHSIENGSDTPDFILAEYLTGCLENWDRSVKIREKWYGREKVPCEVQLPPPSTPSLEQLAPNAIIYRQET